MHESIDISSKVQTNDITKKRCRLRYKILHNCIAKIVSSHSRMSLFPAGHIDNTGSEVHSGKYNSVPNYPMEHENGMDNRMIGLTVMYSNSD